MDKEKLMTEEEWLAKYKAGHKNSKKKEFKKWVRNGVALAMVAVISIAGTLAYLQKQSNTKTNTFTGSAGLKLSLTESNWDTNNDDVIDDGEPWKTAQNYTPNAIYTKNPQLINWVVDKNNWTTVNKESDGDVDTTNNATTESDTSYTYSEYVALEMDLTDGTNPISYSSLTNVIKDIVFDDDNWVLIAYGTTSSGTTTWANPSGSAFTSAGILDETNATGLKSADKFVFAYKTSAGYTALAANKATEPLFSQIQINQTVKSFDGNTDLTLTGSFPNFSITLKGAAVDTNTADFDTSASDFDSKVTTALVTLLGAVNSSNP